MGMFGNKFFLEVISLISMRKLPNYFVKSGIFLLLALHRANCEFARSKGYFCSVPPSILRCEQQEGIFAPQTLNMIERLSAEPIQQKQGLRENYSTSVRDKDYAYPEKRLRLQL